MFSHSFVNLVSSSSLDVVVKKVVRKESLTWWLHNTSVSAFLRTLPSGPPWNMELGSRQVEPSSMPWLSTHLTVVLQSCLIRVSQLVKISGRYFTTLIGWKIHTYDMINHLWISMYYIWLRIFLIMNIWLTTVHAWGKIFIHVLFLLFNVGISCNGNDCICCQNKRSDH